MSYSTSILNEDIRELLKGFLETHLPKLGDDWWTTCVKNVLPGEDWSKVEKNNINSLNDLAPDMSQCTQVLKKNIYKLEQICDLPRDFQDTCEAVLAIRHKWCHATRTLAPDEIRSDMDTLIEFVSVLNADQSLIDKLIEDRERNSSSSADKQIKNTRPDDDSFWSSLKYVGAGVIIFFFGYFLGKASQNK